MRHAPDTHHHICPTSCAIPPPREEATAWESPCLRPRGPCHPEGRSHAHVRGGGHPWTDQKGHTPGVGTRTANHPEVAWLPGELTRPLAGRTRPRSGCPSLAAPRHPLLPLLKALRGRRALSSSRCQGLSHGSAAGGAEGDRSRRGAQTLRIKGACAQGSAAGCWPPQTPTRPPWREGRRRPGGSPPPHRQRLCCRSEGLRADTCSGGGGQPCQARPQRSSHPTPRRSGKELRAAARRPGRFVCVSGGGVGRPQGCLPLALPASESMPRPALPAAPRPLCSPWVGGARTHAHLSSKQRAHTERLRSKCCSVGHAFPGHAARRAGGAWAACAAVTPGRQGFRGAFTHCSRSPERPRESTCLHPPRATQAERPPAPRLCGTQFQAGPRLRGDFCETERLAKPWAIKPPSLMDAAPFSSL